jgi:hypothetical protein
MIFIAVYISSLPATHGTFLPRDGPRSAAI